MSTDLSIVEVDEGMLPRVVPVFRESILGVLIAPTVELVVVHVGHIVRVHKGGTSFQSHRLLKWNDSEQFVPLANVIITNLHSEVVLELQ